MLQHYTEPSINLTNFQEKPQNIHNKEFSTANTRTKDRSPPSRTFPSHSVAKKKTSLARRSGAENPLSRDSRNAAKKG